MNGRCNVLIQFSFNNYKSFRDETILDMSATKITEHGNRVVSLGKEKLLTSAAIFGANASGKSNIIEAFRFMATYVKDSFAYGGEKVPDRNPFLFDNHSRSETSGFEVYFIDAKDKDCKTYNYGFLVNDECVVEEWLNCKAKTSKNYKRIFYRSDNELDLTGIPKRSQENIRVALEKETLIVSLGSKLKIAKLKLIRDWFNDVEFANFGDPFENAILSRLVPKGFVDDEKVQNEVVNYFATFDPSIVGFDVKTYKDEENKEHLKIDAVHINEETGAKIAIPLEEESDGTLKMFALYPSLQKTMKAGGIFCIDELNARLHPLLVRNFIITFLNPEINTNHAQLIFTTHDAWQLSNNLLRRDEIWFTEKEENGVTTLYSLADFTDPEGTKIRKDESFEKNYLLGKYGAIPKLKQMAIN